MSGYKIKKGLGEFFIQAFFYGIDLIGLLLNNELKFSAILFSLSFLMVLALGFTNIN